MGYRPNKVIHQICGMIDAENKKKKAFEEKQNKESKEQPNKNEKIAGAYHHETFKQHDKAGSD